MNKTTLKLLLIATILFGTMSRLSVLGWLYFIGFFTAFVFGVIHTIIHYHLIRNSESLKKRDTLLIIVSHILFLNLFLFQADGGDAKSVFIVEQIFGELSFLHSTNAAWNILKISAILYFLLKGFFVYRLSQVDNSIGRRKIALFVSFATSIIVIPTAAFFFINNRLEVSERNIKESEGKYNDLNRALKNIEDVKYLRLYEYPDSYYEIPKEVFKLKQLEELEMYSNEISKIPKDMQILDNLRVLDLQHNNIDSLHSELFTLPKLEELNIMGNDLMFISAEICNCTSLRVIYLGGQSLDYIPLCMTDLPNLETLAIQSDSINRLFEDLKLFKNLEELKVYSYGGVEFDEEKYNELKSELKNTKMNW